MEYLSTLIDKSEGFNAFEKLAADDIYLIGLFIQNFNFVEFNLRRALALFHVHGVLSVGSKKVPSASLIETIKAALRAMDHTVEDLEESLAKVDEMEEDGCSERISTLRYVENQG